MRAVRAWIPLLILAVGACASSPPPTTHYLLPAAAPPGTARLDPPLWIALGQVEVAPYLDQAGLVVETGASQVRPARYHQWAEPLQDGLRRLLRAEISTSLGYDVVAEAVEGRHWDYTIDVGIDRLHGNLSGEALLVARWWVRDGSGKREPATFRFVGSEPLPREGYPGLVDAEVVLARRLADAIADSLRMEAGG